MVILCSIPFSWLWCCITSYCFTKWLLHYVRHYKTTHETHCLRPHTKQQMLFGVILSQACVHHIMLYMHNAWTLSKCCINKMCIVHSSIMALKHVFIMYALKTCWMPNWVASSVIVSDMFMCVCVCACGVQNKLELKRNVFI